MTTLKNQVLGLKEQIEFNKNASNTKHCIEEYTLIYTQLENQGKILLDLVEKYQILQHLPDDASRKLEFSFEIHKKAKNAKYFLLKFLDRWEKERHASRQGDELAITANQLNELVQDYKSEIVECWKLWIDDLQKEVALESVRLASQKKVPGLEKVYTEFCDLENAFKLLAREIPDKKETIKRLQVVRQEMIALKGKMKFDLPKDVSDFFNELDRYSGKVSLAKLTTEVFDWLKSQNLLEKFMIERKGRH